MEKLKEYGLDAELMEMYGLVDFPAPAELNVCAPFQKDIECVACAQAGSTPPEGITSEIVFLDNGAYSDYEGKDVKGKIGMVQLSYEPPRPEKIRIAMEKGCAGIIIMNWGKDDNPWLSYGTVKPVWGNPTPESYHLMANTPPVIQIKRPDGMVLCDKLLAGEKVVVKIKMTSQRQWKKIYIPTAKITAPNSDGNYLLIAAHMDSWAQGSSDNATGNSCKMELARVLNKHKDELKHDVRFAFWQCHENGIMEGSTWFLDSHWDDVDKHCIAYFNFDTSGVKGTSIWRSDTSSELLDWHTEIEDHVIPGYKRERRKVERTGDQSFFGIGLPSICCWMVHTKEEIKKWNSASLGEWYHSAGDTMEFIDKDILHKCLRVYGAYTWEMLTSKMFPVKFEHVADDIIQRLNYYSELVASRQEIKDVLRLDEVVKIAQEFKKYAMKLESARKNFERDPGKFNETIKRVSRTIMPAKCTVIGRYDQGTYGLTALYNDLPCLDCIHKYVKTDKGSHEYYLWTTRCMRERNRVSDALRHAIEYLQYIV